MKEFLECGKIVSTHGVRGEVKAEVWMTPALEGSVRPYVHRFRDRLL